LGSGLNWDGKGAFFIEDYSLFLTDLYYSCHRASIQAYYTKTREIVKYTPSVQDYSLTCSDLMRIDIGKFFIGKKYSIAEIGSRKGDTTRFLSHVFSNVYAVDPSIEFTKINQIYNSDFRNIEYVCLDTYKDNWNVLPNEMDVVFIDANHTYDCCKSDLFNSVKRFKNLKYIIFNHYGAWKGVRALVDEYLSNRWLKLECFLGKREGILCSLQNPSQPTRFSTPPIRNAFQLKLYTNYRSTH
jgi:SAM-dependent methyltransferase